MTRTEYIRLHVDVRASDRQMIRLALRRLIARHRYSREGRRARHAWLRAGVRQHRMAQAMAGRAVGRPRKMPIEA